MAPQQAAEAFSRPAPLQQSMWRQGMQQQQWQPQQESSFVMRVRPPAPRFDSSAMEISPSPPPPPARAQQSRAAAAAAPAAQLPFLQPQRPGASAFRPVNAIAGGTAVGRLQLPAVKSNNSNLAASRVLQLPQKRAANMTAAAAQRPRQRALQPQAKTPKHQLQLKLKSVVEDEAGDEEEKESSARPGPVVKRMVSRRVQPDKPATKQSAAAPSAADSSAAPSSPLSDLDLDSAPAEDQSAPAATPEEPSLVPDNPRAHLPPSSMFHPWVECVLAIEAPQGCMHKDLEMDQMLRNLLQMRLHSGRDEVAYACECGGMPANSSFSFLAARRHIRAVHAGIVRDEDEGDTMQSQYAARKQSDSFPSQADRASSDGSSQARMAEQKVQREQSPPLAQIQRAAPASKRVTILPKPLKHERSRSQ